ncbi:HIRAN domain-containing protein [Vibrio parahaemolyticus]|uniref:HIRAN domain-containing protein n=1 Tax=Vibrio parahaemolyticus TaxID=670 RepID=UPI0032B72C42
MNSLVDSNKVETIGPSFVKLYKLTHVRNTKVVDLSSSMLSATKTQTLKGKGVDNYNVETLPTTNSLIVTGSQSQLEKIDALIEGIDQLQRQIFIEAIITESELGDSQEVGGNMELALGEAGFISQPGTIKKAVDNVLFYEGGDFNALIKAVAKNQNTKLLSRPNMFIMDRERGYITVGQNVPFLTSSEVTDGGNRIQQIERKDVGVSLEVVPHVMGNHVVLQITQKSDSVTDSSIASDIITNTRTLQTVVKVLDGQTISLGGLSEEQATPMNILARSGGLRGTDQLQMFRKIEVKDSGDFEHFFFVHGLSHLSRSAQKRVDSLNSGERLFFCFDCQNEYDPYAVLIRADNPAEVVGYCPRYIARDIRALLEFSEHVTVNVEKLAKDAPKNYRLMCKVVGKVRKQHLGKLPEQSEFVFTV